MIQSPDSPELLDAVRDAAAAQVRKGCPGHITAWDPATRKADVQPEIRRAYRDETGARVTSQPPVIPCVPVQFPEGGGLVLTFPVAIGDPVWLLFADDSLDKWLTTGGSVDPEDDRKNDPSDAVALLGMRPFGRPGKTLAAAGCVQLGQDGGVFQGVALGDLIAAFLTIVRTHTHPVTGGATATASAELAGATVPAASVTVKVTP